VIGDRPQVIKKAKLSWTEDLFAQVYNQESKIYRLVACNQDYHTFDFWLVDKDEIRPPKIVELKAHYKPSSQRAMVGCDFIKIQKLRSLAVGTKAYIFHLFEDETLIQDVGDTLDSYREIIFNDRPVILGLMRRERLKSIGSIGLDRLRKIQDAAQSQASQPKSPGATAQGSLAPAPQHGFLD
jgi:hypothetical protein